MIEELGSLVVRIKMVAHEVEQSTTTILDRMAQLVETGDAQIKQIAQAAVEVQQMVGSSRQIAKHSQGLYKLSHNTRDNTQNGRDSVIQTISGIGRINQNIQATANKIQTLGEHSREINEIVEVISNIAHQMNRLALDAAIQAAMAGEHGRGFGAVAADIRRMAERTKDQVKMISRIVRSVREDITAAAISMQDTKRETATGTRLTREAGTALESIFSAVEHQAQEIENINAMATQQLQSSSAVVRIMHTFSSYTQKSSISIHEAALHMQRLARLVKQLHTSVETFKLRKDRKYEGPHRHTSTLSDNSLDKSLTVSGVFRTISAIVKPMPSSHTEDITSALSPEQTNDPFAFYPKTPEQAFQDISCIVNSSSPDEEQRAPRAQ
jgi:methyl-accepting chemotaxis protein